MSKDMNKKNTSIILIFLLFALHGYSQIKSGIIIGGGKGSISNVVFPDEYTTIDGTPIENLQWSYQYNFDIALGYKFRYETQNKPFFYDLDIYLGLKRFTTDFTGTFDANLPEIESNDDDEIIYYQGEASGHFQHIYYSFSVNPSLNYRLIKGLYAGVGIEPTLYNKDDASKGEKWKFDLPLTAKIGYDLKFIDFSVNYKHGIFDTMESKYLNPAKFRNWQLSVFIPF